MDFNIGQVCLLPFTDPYATAENFSDPLLLEQIKHELSSSLGRLDEAYGEMKRELQQQTDTLARYALSCDIST